jgi:NAD-dependent deacetylase
MSDEPLEHARSVLAGARRVVALTGAGISTDSGIPDFRGPDGLWTRDPDAERYSTIEHYLHDPELRVRAWQWRMSNPAWTARPNPGHLALAELERSDRLELLVTQNIDGLHQAAGNDAARVVEVHGTMRTCRCINGDWRGPTTEVLDRVRAGEPDPPCPRCGGILKTATVFFGESLDEADLTRALGAAAGCEVLLCVGTTLQVYPVAGMVPVALRAGAEVVIVNGSPTPFDDEATVVRGSISEVLPTMLA